MAICVSCAHENPAGAKFCMECAAPLRASVESRELRKTVTVVFCDVVGSTALGEAQDPEALRVVLARYFERMKAIVEGHGGTVEKFIGDAVMAVFGVPVVHEDDAVRAVRAAIEMRDALPSLRVEGRIGIDTGEVVTGTAERLATGDAVNVAARLQAASAPGEILLGAGTVALARDAVTVEEVGPLELKGKSAPVRAYRLIALEPGAPGLARHLDAPMVGRTHERRLLEDAFAGAVRQRACSLFTLLGTAGVGKSRLVREFLAGVDARVVEGHCLSYGDGITYWPVVEIVKQLGGTGAVPAEPPEAGAVAALLGESTVATTPEEIAWGVRRLLESAARERPLVVLFDDVHWGEPTFFDLIEHVADLSRDAPILLLCLARPELLERRPGWGGGKLNATTVLLEPLDAAETDELIGRVLGEDAFDPELESRIRAASAGNPLFVEEMVAMVRESGERHVVVPPTIWALLAARLDQLDPAERQVLERGSVEGQLFHSAAVEALATPPAPAERELVGLVRKELVRPDRPQLPVGDAYRFRHLLIRDAAYDALPKAVRAELHERFAAWLQERGSELVEHDEIIGYHLEQAYRYRIELGPVDGAADVLAARAAALLMSSGRRARFRGDMPAAASLLTRAAELSAAARRAVVTELAAALMETGELEQSAALLDQALAEARAAGDERTAAITALARANLAGHRGESVSMERVIELAGKAEAVLEQDGDDAQLAAVLVIEGRHRFFSGRSREGVAVLERAFDLALGAGDLPCAHEALIWIWVAKTFGSASVSECRDSFTRAPAQLSETPSNRLMLTMQAGLVDGFAGEFASAREQLAEARALADELGARTTSAALSMYAGFVELLADDPAAAERELRDGYDRLGAIGESGYRSTVGTMLADALVELGGETEAAEALDTAESLAQPDDIDPQVRLRAVRARLLAARGELAEAERVAREGVAVAAATDYVVQHGDALLALAVVLEANGSHDEAAAALRQALELFERKEVVPRVARVRALLRTGDP